MEYIISTLITASLFFILILLLASKPKIAKIMTLTTMGIGGIFGLAIYGYGYAIVTENFLLAILKAVVAVCGSFVGNNEYGDIAAAPFMKYQGVQILCAFTQICSLYATASAVITSLGNQALKKLRLWLGRKKNVHLIFGNNSYALSFAKELSEQEGVVVFVSSSADSALLSDITELNCIFQNDTPALTGSEKFLRRLGFGTGKRNLTLYALDKYSTHNIQFASNLLKSLKALSIPPEQTGLVLMGKEEIAVSRLQYTPGKYGYGYVSAVNEPQLSARLLTMKYPPCSTISFDADGKATENFEALLIGFGQVGQAVLKSLVINSQFEGSRFKLDVFARDINSVDGNFTSQLGNLLTQYDITFYEHDARSRSMYQHLAKRADALRYIVIAAGGENRSHEIAEELIAYLNSIGRKIPVYRCTQQGICAYHADGTTDDALHIYSTALLCSQDLDRKAMILNHKYQSPTEKTPLQTWMECDYFSRQSCRAATDFVPAMLHSVGQTEEQVMKEGWKLSPKQVENLSRTEHLRWCAFYYSMGFSPMSPEEYTEREKQYIRQKEQGEKITVRVGKNMVAKTHACLIPWEELDDLSKHESTVTGKAIDYKSMDTDNVMAIPQLLQASAAQQ